MTEYHPSDAGGVELTKLLVPAANTSAHTLPTPTSDVLVTVPEIPPVVRGTRVAFCPVTEPPEVTVTTVAPAWVEPPPPHCDTKRLEKSHEVSKYRL